MGKGSHTLETPAKAKVSQSPLPPFEPYTVNPIKLETG